MNRNRWKPVRKIAAQFWTALAGNATVAGVIAGTDGDWRALAATSTASLLLIVAGYITPPAE